MHEFSPVNITNGLNSDQLKKMARTLGIGKCLTRKADIGAAIDAFIRADIAAAVALCSELERQILAEAAHDEAEGVSPSMFFGKYGGKFLACPNSYQAKTISRGAQARSAPWKRPGSSNATRRRPLQPSRRTRLRTNIACVPARRG